MRINNLFYTISFMFLAVSCTERQTRIELVGDDANYNLGEIKASESALSGKEWLIQNKGKTNLKIDSIAVSCECLKVSYDSINSVKPNGYFPFRVFPMPDGTLGTFYREISIFGNFENSPLILTLEGTFVEDESSIE